MGGPEVAHVVGGGDQRLARHAVGEHGRAAEAVALDDGDLGAEVGGDEGGLVATRPPTEDDDTARPRAHAVHPTTAPTPDARTRRAWRGARCDGRSGPTRYTHSVPFALHRRRPCRRGSTHGAPVQGADPCTREVFTMRAHSFTRRAGAPRHDRLRRGDCGRLLPDHDIGDSGSAAPRVVPPTRRSASAEPRRHGAPSSPPPRRRARSTSSRCRPTGPTTARSSRPSRPSTEHQGQQRPARRQQRRRDRRRHQRLKGQAGAPTSSTSAPPSPWPTPACSPPTRWRPGRTSATTSRTPTARGSTTTAATWRIGYDSAKVPAPTTRRRPAQARLQGQGGAERQPDRGRRGLRRRADGLGRQRWHRRRHQPRASTSSAS